MPQRKWPIPNDWQDENDGYRLVLFCIPDSRQWRTIVTGLIEGLAYGRNWDEKTGVITDVQSIARDIFESLDMTCGEDIKRIADVLENWYDTEYVDVSDLIEALDALGLDKWSNLLAGLAEYKEVIEVLSPNLSLPKFGLITTILDWNYRRRALEAGEDAVHLLDGVLSALWGPSLAILLNELQNNTKIGSFADVMLGQLDDILISISQDFFTLLSGNYVTNKLDDLVNSVNGGVGLPVPPALTGNYVTKRLADLRRQLEDCCEHQTEVNVTINQATPSDGVVSVGGEDDQFPDQASYFNAKCSAANGIYDTVAAFIDHLSSIDLDDVLTGKYGGVIAYLSYWLNNLGVLGWAISKVSSFMTGIAIKLLGTEEISFSDIASALAEQHEPLVLALYNASNAAGAKSAFLAALADATTTLTDIESGLVSDLLTYDLLNQLFDPRSDTTAYQSSDPVDCGTTLQVWTFDASGQGWTFRDDSTGGADASGEWSAAEEGWELTMNPTGGTAWGTIYLDGLAIAVDTENSVQYDFSAPSDGQNSSIDLKVIYDDQSEYLAYIGNTKSAGTIILNITVPGTIETIECFIGRQSSAGGSYTEVIQEVRIQ